MRVLADVHLARFRHQGIQVGTFSAERHVVVRQDIIRLRKSPRSLIHHRAPARRLARESGNLWIALRRFRVILRAEKGKRPFARAVDVTDGARC